MSQRKEITQAFLKMAASGQVREAYEKFIASDFIHHNQYFKGDRTSLMSAMEDASKQSPNKSFEVKKIYEDGDTVISHGRVERKNPGEAPIAVVHICRFKGDKIVEMWDCAQLIDKNSPNENGLF